jgi:hypothetical protein
MAYGRQESSSRLGHRKRLTRSTAPAYAVAAHSSLSSAALYVANEIARSPAGAFVGRLRDIVVRWTKGGRTHL